MELTTPAKVSNGTQTDRYIVAKRMVAWRSTRSTFLADRTCRLREWAPCKSWTRRTLCRRWHGARSLTARQGCRQCIASLPRHRTTSLDDSRSNSSSLQKQQTVFDTKYGWKRLSKCCSVSVSARYCIPQGVMLIAGVCTG